MFSTSTETRKNTWSYIFNTTREARKKRKNTCLYGLNISMVAIISLKGFALAMSVSAGLILWLSGDGSITKWAKLIPEWMQFIRIEGLEYMTPEINLVVFASLFFAAVITAFTVCMLYQIQKNSEERGYNKCQLEILESLNQEKKQTITCLYSNGSGEKKKIYVALEKEYPNGCIIKKGDKTARLVYKVPGSEYNLPEKKPNYEYKVVECEEMENFEKDFFGEKKSTEVTIYGFKPHSNVLSTLSRVIFKTHLKKEGVESSPSPEMKSL